MGGETFLNNNWILITFNKTFIKVYVQRVFVNVQQNFNSSGNSVQQVLENYLKLCWIWIFPWIRPSWHSWSMWEKLRWINWCWQSLCDWLSSFNLKGFCYSYACSCSLCEGRTSLCMWCISWKLYILSYVLDWLYWTQCLTSFSSLNHLLCLYAQFLMVFYLT